MVRVIDKLKLQVLISKNLQFQKRNKIMKMKKKKKKSMNRKEDLKGLSLTIIRAKIS